MFVNEIVSRLSISSNDCKSNAERLKALIAPANVEAGEAHNCQAGNIGDLPGFPNNHRFLHSDGTPLRRHPSGDVERLGEIRLESGRWLVANQ